MNEAVEGQEVGQEEVTAAPKGPVTIPAQNPDAEEMAGLTGHIKANYNFNVDVKETKFNFKKSVDKDTGLETIRESVILALPYPSVQGLIDVIETGGKGLELLMDVMESAVNAASRDIILDDHGINAANFPVEKVSWEAIANMPKAQRNGGGIPKESWDAFAANYTTIMPEVTGKSLEAVARAAKILANKLVQVKTNIPVLNLLVEQLSIYAENSAEFEEHKDCVAFLLEKANTLVNVSPQELLEAL